MYRSYAQALIALEKDGVPFDVAVAGLKRTLEAKRAMKLYPQVLREALRLMESAAAKTGATVTVAKTGGADAAALTKARALLGIPDTAPVREHVDETLIGGFTLTANYRELDQSYKRSLITLYESITL